MQDIEAVFTEVVSPEGRCSARMETKGRWAGQLWTCVRPEGHEGQHAALDMTLRYFVGHGPAGKPAGRVSFRSRLVGRERD
jgi:hypothetical protein